MGACVSIVTRDDPAKRSAQIDKQIAEDSKRLKKECKILLLGTEFSLSARRPVEYFSQALVNQGSRLS
jgi:hypothetical protein